MNVRLTQNQKIQLLNSTDVYAIMQQVLMRESKIRRNKEHFWVVGLDNHNTILFVELVSLGGINAVTIKAHEFFSIAVHKQAVKVILVHNHPSGELSPSPADLDTTDRLLKSGNILHIEVIEHLIINETEFFSFVDSGTLEKLKNSGNYEVTSTEQRELAKLKTEHEKALAIARKMLKEGLDHDVIRKVTGLRKVDLEDM